MKTGDNKKPRVIYLSYDGLTDPLGQSQILPYLKGLSDGYDITIVSFEKPATYAAHKKDIEQVISFHGMHWFPLEYHKRPPVLSTIYDLVSLRRVVKSLHKENPFKIVHCRSYPVSLVGTWLKKKYGVKFIFDMRGFWADERVEGNIWRLSNPLFRLIYRFFKNKEKLFLRLADHVVSLTQNAADEIRSWKVTTAAFTVIPTCVDTSLFTPVDDETERASRRKAISYQPQDFVLLYIGSWGTWYLTDEVLKFFSILKSVIPEARLIILTPDNPNLSNYEHRSSVTVKYARRREVPDFLSLADASICFVKPTFSKRASSATKIAESWAMNVPVVTNRGWGDIDQLCSEGLPLLISTAPGEYYDTAMRLKNFPKNNDTNWIKGRFDLDSGIEKYRTIYRSLSQ